MISRRHFLQSSLTVALIPFLPRFALSATLRVRPSWETFRKGTLFPVFLNTVAKMKANTNAADPGSWSYWVSVHKNFCPHGRPYFLAWHRGFLFRFEAQLRKVAANSSLILPYWDYYVDPILPTEFTDTSSPLYVPNRTGNDVTNALSLGPFDDSVINFSRYYTNAFEPKVESLPHNAVHNLIGGVMSNVMLSPTDPIFWVHHGNIDRLWAAWVKADNGRIMPSKTSSYWSGSFGYGAGVSAMLRIGTYSTYGLNYEYEDESMPAALPASMLRAPTTLSLQALPPKPLDTQTVSLGGAQQLSLDQHSVSIAVPLTAQDQTRVRSLLMKPAATTALAGTSIRVVLDGVRLTGLGQKGGYFYKVYINLPDRAGIALAENNYLLGTLGPFEITAAQHMQQMQQMQSGAHAPTSDGVQVSFPATEALQRIWPANLGKLSVSFVRVDGRTQAKGTMITVREFRVEASDMPAK